MFRLRAHEAGEVYKFKNLHTPEKRVRASFGLYFYHTRAVAFVKAARSADRLNSRLTPVRLRAALYCGFVFVQQILEDVAGGRSSGAGSWPSRVFS